MSTIKIHDNVQSALNSFHLPESLGFGTVMAPLMASCTYENGIWGDLEILPYGPIQMAPNAKVLHYAQEIFEGLKAYSYNGAGPFIFRPEENFKRFNRSAERMAMPTIPKQLFLNSIIELTALCRKVIPGKSGESLYIRPFMFGTEETLGIKPSDSYRYMVIASPSGTYFSPGKVAVLIERETSRAYPGGTGFAKTGGNYAASLLSSIKAKQAGYVQTLWLDGREKKYIEELSGMNFMAVINGELHTPILTDSILDGITRSTILILARDAGIKVVEEKMDVEKLIAQIKSGECSEAFACGTAATLAAIDYLGDELGNHYNLKFPQGPIGIKLKEKLLAIQEGRDPDKFNWITTVPLKS